MFQSILKALAFGDPHIVTLDGLKYTFNGFGEFILIETVDNSFTMQGRMIPAQDDTENDVSATVFSAVVAKELYSDTVQIQLVDSNIIDDEIDALVNGELIDFEGLTDQQFNNVSLLKTSNAISATFSSGVFLEIKVENGIMSTIFLSLPRTYMSKTSGLMGNYNSDTSDDLLPRNGNTPISPTSSIQEIHNLFGVTCEQCILHATKQY